MCGKFLEDFVQGMKEKHRMGAVTGVEVEIGGRDALLPAQYVIQDRFIAQVRERHQRKLMLWGVCVCA